MKWYYFFCIISLSVIGMELPQKPRADKKSLTKLFHALEEDYPQRLSQLLESVTFTRSQKVEALITAIRLKKKNGAAVLLQADSDPNGISSRQTPLLEAVLSRQEILVEWLLIFGADPLHRSVLCDRHNIPMVLECEASDSDIVHITPLDLSRARLKGSHPTKTDTRIFNLLNSDRAQWKNYLLKEKVTVTTNSCLEAIKHADTGALIGYLDNCVLAKKRKQHYLDERFTLAAHMGNEIAMRLLLDAGAKAGPALLKFATSFEIEPLQACILRQYANDQEVQEAKEVAQTREYDANFIQSVHKFKKKQQQTVDLLNDSRTLLLHGTTQGHNIALLLQQREQHGTLGTYA